MKRALLGLILCVAGVVFAILIITPVVNDNIARNTAKELADLPLPDDTEIIETAYKAGKLVGNGNGMQYFGAILIKSEMSLEKLREYYSGFAESRPGCMVENQTDAEVRLIEHGKLAFKADITGDDFYIVYSWGNGGGIFRELDIRGH